MDKNWDVILQFLFLAVLLCIALVLKTKFRLFRRHLVPLSLIAGFIGLILGPSVLKVIPFDTKILESFVYHAMSIGFIALALKDRRSKKNSAIMKTGFAIVSTYAVQGILGLALSLGLASTFFPDLFPISGLILPLGYGQGPGQAVAMGSTWEKYGFVNGGNFGLTIATFGFLWAILGGIPYMNYLVRKYKGKKLTGVREDLVISESAGDLDNSERTAAVPKGTYLDELALQLVLIGVVYALTYGLMTGLTALLKPLGTFGDTMASLLWGFSFLWGSVIAIGVRALLNVLFTKKIVKVKYVDNYLMQRISSTVFDFMIVASISAISIAMVIEFWAPLLIITTVGGIFTMLYTHWICKWIYKEHFVEFAVMNYGTWTGTVTTGMALLREVDPESKTPVPETYVLGSGVGAGFGFILMLILSLPVTAVVEGQPIYYLFTFVALAVYAAVMLLCIALIQRKEKKQGNR